MGYYAAYNGSSWPTFRDNQSGPSTRFKKSKKIGFFLDYITLEDVTDRISLKVGEELPSYAAW
jgi:hypothetical protein